MKKIAIVSFVLIAFSCTYNKIDEVPSIPETMDPKYNVQFSNISPSNNDTIAAGSNLPITANVRSAFYMHGYQIALVDIFSGDTLFQIGQHLHDTLYQIEEEWVNTLTKNTQAEVVFKITIDHKNNFVKKSFNCMLQGN